MNKTDGCHCGGQKVIEQRGENLMTMNHRRIIFPSDFVAQMCPKSSIVRVFCTNCGTMYHEDSIQI